MAGGFRSQSQLHSAQDTGSDCRQLPLLWAPKEGQAEDGDLPQGDQEEDGDSPRRAGESQGLPQEGNEEVIELSRDCDIRRVSNILSVASLDRKLTHSCLLPPRNRHWGK